MGKLVHHNGKPGAKVWGAAVKQWLGVCATYAFYYVATFVVGVVVAATAKKQASHPQGKPLTAYHDPDYMQAGASGTWEYWNSDISWVKPWNNYEDGTLGEPSGKNSARCGGNERSFWSQYKWTCRNAFNWGKRTDPRYHCVVDNCDIEYWGAFELSDKVVDKQGWYFVVATDRATRRKYYSYRRVKVVGATKVRHTLFGFKIKPSHALEVQDADDKDKAFTIRFPVKQTID